MKRFVFTLWLSLGLVSCTNEDGATEALRSMGFTQIVLTGHEMWTCGQGDDTCTGFRAVNPAGQQVQGAVGCGYFGKGCTVRFK
jgi:hypothetical protein